VLAQSFVDKRPGDAICSLYGVAINPTDRFDWIFNQPQNLHNTVLDFWAKSTNALNLYVYTLRDIADFTAYTSRPAALTTSWQRFTLDLNNYLISSGGNREITITRNKSLAFYNNGAASDIYLSGMTIRRL